MNMLSELTNAERDRLDYVLRHRGLEEDERDEAFAVARDEGVLCLPSLDGCLTAVVCGPAMIPPSRWLGSVWGDVDPIWDSMEEAQAVTGLFMRHMNSIAGCLSDRPSDFEPVFSERELEGRTYTVVDEWCEGFARGMALDSANWRTGGEEIKRLLGPVMSFTKQTGRAGYELSPAQCEEQKAKIIPSVRAIYTYWLARREEFMPMAGQPSRTIRREGPRVGRNEPCPCGSGKKYKKCCLS